MKITITIFCIVFILFALQPCFSQQKSKKHNQEELDASFQATFEYQQLGSEWHSRYYGLTLEAYFDNNLSFSGQVLAGKGSDGFTYVHIPAGGILLLLTAKTILDVLFEDDPLTTTETIILALTENINYNMYYAKNKISISPYLNFFALDVSETFGPEGTQNAMLSHGLGLNTKMLSAKPLVISSFVDFKYYHVVDGNFSFNYHLGYSLGISLGIIY